MNELLTIPHPSPLAMSAKLITFFIYSIDFTVQCFFWVVGVGGVDIFVVGFLLLLLITLLCYLSYFHLISLKLILLTWV